ncbi:MAG: proline iminopeptidase-family hydrolase [Nitrososphaerota archaeon]|jgi:proline iminopeptidase|nr:proline iminopeptidase-family hydrolase [Nitrososphaerota archaeon]MDG6943052.1 proline iminopeptidase-family hydrolase [Nitrososphaerota archaeon]MDG6950781.1 proline iminopeptidase-family hydrolase [Nitrososphaerota archaeon]
MDPEGFLTIGGFRVFYRSEGEPRRGTLLGLHGGPGGCYDYLAPLFDLAERGYRVVLYDQSGGGKSQRLNDPSLFNIERYVEEAEGVRSALELGRVHLYGHSWGGMLAQAYALKYQANLSSLILSGTTSSVPMLVAEGEKVFRALPAYVRNTVTKYEALGDYENPKYLAAIERFNHTHQALDPWPEALKYVFENFSQPVGLTMFGPNLISVSGNMRYWDVTDRLSSLKVPCLVICGDKDFLTPRLHETLHEKIRGSRLIVMKGVSHGSMWDARGAYVRHLAGFLDSHRFRIKGQGKRKSPKSTS